MQTKVIDYKGISGITMISLITTIIVLIILSGVSINAVFGENGIIKRAKEAKEQNLIQIKSEEAQLAITDVLAEKKLENSDITISDVLDKIKKDYVNQEEKDAINGEVLEIENKFPGQIIYNPPSSLLNEKIIILIDEFLNVKGEIEKEQSTYDYKIAFDNNGGFGIMKNMTMKFNVASELTTNSFKKENYIFKCWNTQPDGSGTSYEDRELVNNLSNSSGDVITLYAIYEHMYYVNDGPVKFDGSNFINTEMYLFSQRNINKNFEISFEIVDQTASQNSQATFVSAMDETESPYPGIVYRYNSAKTNHQIGVNVDSTHKAEPNYETNITKVDIKRINGVIYLKLDDGNLEKILDMSTLTKTFYVPLTFGASLKGDGAPQGHFKGTLSNLYVEIF